ncbi:hypothetical protein ABE493_10495 [Stenotrophomonas terrae]
MTEGSHLTRNSAGTSGLRLLAGGRIRWQSDAASLIRSAQI